MAGLIHIGQSALSAAYAQLQTGGHNIANVHTPGYVRQEVLQATAGGQYFGHGYIGNGVEVTDVRRAYDRFMADEVTRSTSLAGADSVRAQQMRQVENLLADTDTGIGVSMDEFRAALGDVVNNPSDPSARAVVASRAERVAQRFSETAQKMESIMTETGRRIEEAAEYVNVRLEQVASLNRQITSATANGHQPNDLLDQRDAVINELASKIQLTRDDQADGSVNLYTAMGHSLVLSERAAKLVSVPGDADSSRTRLMLDVHGKRVEVSESTLGSGEIAGLMRFRDQDLMAVQAKLGQLAASFGGSYNLQHMRGLDMNGNPGRQVFSVGQPVVQAAEGNTGNADLDVRILYPSMLKAADYRLSYDGSVYTLENTLDRTKQEFTQLPINADGLVFNLKSGQMAAGDTLNIQAATAYAGRMRSVLNGGASLAAAEAMSASRGPVNHGTVGIEGYLQIDANADRTKAIALTFTAADRYTLTVDGKEVATNQPYTSGEPVNVAGWQMMLTGVPVAGDTVTLAPRKAIQQDNGNARWLVTLGDQQTVDGATFSQSFASLLSDVGSRTLQAKTSEKASEKMLDGAKTVLANRSGVNLDEEAARLLQYRQAYQAAAKVIQTADEMFNSILALAR
jgi:flagellar hook-associated protein flgK